MDQTTNNFRYLNREGRWLDFFQIQGLDLDDKSSLSLTTLPKAEPSFSFPYPQRRPGSLAVDHEGKVYTTDTTNHQILIASDCHTEFKPLPSVGGIGNRPHNLNFPSALTISTFRNALLVADRERILYVDLETQQLVDVWVGSDNGDFKDIVDLACDSAGSIYLIDRIDSRQNSFLKLDTWRATDPDFSRSVNDSIAGSPVSLYIDPLTQSLWILSENPNRLYEFSIEGKLEFEFDFPDKTLEPSGLFPEFTTFVGDRFYIGDRHSSSMRKYQLDRNEVRIQLIGEANGFVGPVAAIAGDALGKLWVHSGVQPNPIRLMNDSAHITHGFMLGGPFSIGEFSVEWQRLFVDIEPESGSQFRVAIVSSDRELDVRGMEKKLLGHLNYGEKLEPFDEDDVWIEFPANATDVLVSQKKRFIWIIITVHGNGLASPTIKQMRIEFNTDSYLRHLPNTYQTFSEDVDSLDRFIRIFQSTFVDTESKIEQFEQIFDIDVVDASWLEWLANWLNVSLDEAWPEEKKRHAIRRAFAAFGKKGTATGLKDTLQFELDIDARIEEPIVNASWWLLPASGDVETREVGISGLGIDTRLAGSEPQGAVIGSSATLDRSHLITQDQYGEPLFSELSHRMNVQVYRTQVNTADIPEVHRIINREKPAHVAYQLSFIEPSMSVGFQSIVGVNTVLGGPEPPSELGSEGPLVLEGQQVLEIGSCAQIGEITL